MRLLNVKATDKYQQIINGCLQNKRGSQQELYDIFAPKMLTVCMRYAFTQQEAEDIMIEGFVAVFNHLADFKNESSLEQWIRQIMVNKAISNYRNNKRRYNHLTINENIELEDEQILDIESSMTGKKLIQMIQQMPDNLKMVFNLRVFEEYEFKEIAEELTIPVSTARVYFLRAKKWINEHIEIENHR